MYRRSRIRWSPRLTMLERRDVPAGMVQATLVGNILQITGDGADNFISVRSGGSGAVLVVATDATTLINGKSSATISGVANGVVIDLIGGNNDLSVSGLNVAGNLTVSSGSGNDSFAFAGMRVNGTLNVNLNDGNDFVRITSSQAGAGSAINGGAGIDSLINTGNDSGFDPAVVGFEYNALASISSATTPRRDTTPVARFDRVTVNRGQSITVTVLSNDVDAEGPIDPSTIVITQRPTNGTVSVGGDGKITFVQDGTVMPFDSFRYTIRDNAGQTSNEAIVLIDITATANKAPTAVGDATTTARGQSVVVSVLNNDSDSDGSLDATSVVITQQPSSGTATVNANGTITYVHNNTSTTTDAFQYTVRDNLGVVSNAATVTITITSTTPVATNDSATVANGSSVTFNVASNDIPPTGGTLNLQSIVITQQPASGTIANLADGRLTYTHNGTATTTDSFRYTIRSASGVLSNEATVTITITPSNNTAPIAVDDTSKVARGGMVIIPVAANDSDPGGQIDPATIQFTVRPANGTVTANSNGTVTYQHNGSDETFDTFSYTIRDRAGLASNVANVAITITESNQPPEAVGDDTTVLNGGIIVINVAANDVDQEGQLDLNSIVVTENPSFGHVTINANGTVSYQHDGSATSSDSFRYTIRDLQGTLSNEALVTIAITENLPPQANEDATSVARGGTVLIRVLDNDSDSENQLDVSTVAIVQQPTHGLLTVDDNGIVTYQHNGESESSDSFVYTVRDKQGLISNEAIVSITITDSNESPIANTDEAFVDMGQSVVINVAENDSDPEDQLNLASIEIVTQPTHGLLVVNNDGTVTYMHNGTSTPTDSFVYAIRDAQGAKSNEATVSISINVVNQAPTAINDSRSVAPGKMITINVLQNDFDPDGDIDPSTVTITQEPEHGSVTIQDDGSVTYSNNEGSDALFDSFRYTVRDQAGHESNEAVVSIQIIDGVDGPILPRFSMPAESGSTKNTETDLSPNDDPYVTESAVKSQSSWAAFDRWKATIRSSSVSENSEKVDGQDFTTFRIRFRNDSSL